MMVVLTKVRNISVKMQIEFDFKSGMCYGEDAMKIRSYVTLLARIKMNILIEDWDQVEP